jgi:hypothetical protein
MRTHKAIDGRTAHSALTTGALAATSADELIRGWRFVSDRRDR